MHLVSFVKTLLRVIGVCIIITFGLYQFGTSEWVVDEQELHLASKMALLCFEKVKLEKELCTDVSTISMTRKIDDAAATHKLSENDIRARFEVTSAVSDAYVELVECQKQQDEIHQLCSLRFDRVLDRFNEKYPGRLEQ